MRCFFSSCSPLLLVLGAHTMLSLTWSLPSDHLGVYEERRPEILCLGVFEGCGRNTIFTVNMHIILKGLRVDSSM